MEQCRTCRWWSTGGVPDTHGTCEKIKHDGKEERAYIVDFEGYDACLYVAADFGCILHEPKPTLVDHDDDCGR